MKATPFFKRIVQNKYSIWVSMGLLFLVDIWLKSDGIIDLRPGSIFDDEMQLNQAESISSGNWLGGYGIVTLAKGVTYPIWMALQHGLDIPLWAANATLYGLAALALIFAIRHLFKNKWLLVPFYGLLLFNPVIAERTYRDSIAPALILLIIAWLIGYFLTSSVKSGIKASIVKRDKIIFTVIGVIALPMWWFLREDYWWISPFLILAIVVTGLVIWFNSKSIKSVAKNLALLALPFIAVGLAYVSIGAINNHVYGKFVVNDYTNGTFVDAYGALTRIENNDWKPTVPVSSQMRELAYEVSPTFAELRPCLDGESNSFCAGFKQIGLVSARGDYQGGWFFWVLRAAASKAGYYGSPQEAASAYAKIAGEINSACDSGAIKCLPGERSGLNPPFHKEIVAPIAAETIPTLWYIAGFKDITREMEMDRERLTVYDPALERIANYTGSVYTADQLNFSKSVKLKAQDVVFAAYRLISPILFILSVLVLLASVILLKKANYAYWKVTLIAAGLLGLVITRVVVINYVSVTSFNAVYAMYLSAAHPLLLVFYILTIGKLIDIALSRTSKPVRKNPSRVR